jgi:hypothetical protein
MSWPSVRTVFAITHFCVRTEHWNILKYWTASGCVATSSGQPVVTSQTVLTAEIQLCVEIGEAWPSVRKCCLDVQTSSTVKLLDTTGRPDGCTGTGWFGLKFARTLHGHLLEACDQSHALIWTLSEYMKILNWELTILLKSNRYIKCFCQPECCQYKILMVRLGIEYFKYE